MKRGKVLIIGIDGGTWKILKPAMDEGYMPFLKHLVDTGASGILESTIPAITPAAWSAFQTGMNPGKTGVFDFAVWDKAKKKQIIVSSQFLQRTIWEIASEAGLRVAAINVPMTYPPRAVNGYVVTGIMTPSVDSEFTYPAEFQQELLEAVPAYHIFNQSKIRAKDKSYYHTRMDNFLSEMGKVVAARARAAEHIMKKANFDLFMVHFQASDIVQHALWGYLDKTHPLFDVRKKERILEDFYSMLDGEIKRLSSLFEHKIGRDSLTMVVSDHGFQKHLKRFNLGNWLYQEGYVAVNQRAVRGGLLKRLVRRLDVFNLRRKLFTERMRTKASNVLDVVEGTASKFSWIDSKAFSVGRSQEGFVYLVGEEEVEQQNAAQEITDKLLSVKDPETNGSIVRKVYRKEEIFWGSKMDVMPDLVVDPTPGYSFTGYYQPGEDLFHKVNIREDLHIGGHHRDGILVVAGRGVRPACDLRVMLIDIAPTILWYLGLDVPGEMDGRILDELFIGERVSTRPHGRGDPKEAKVSPDELPKDVFSEEDEKKIRQRLKDLGYL